MSRAIASVLVGCLCLAAGCTGEGNASRSPTDVGDSGAEDIGSADAAADGSPDGAGGADVRAPSDGGDGSPDGGSTPSDGGGEDSSDTTTEPCDPRARTPLGVASQSASWRYGGGFGYPDSIERRDSCMSVVSTKSELLSTLDQAQDGDVVYIADDAAIDLTGESVCIPGGVWLAGGRGVDGAAGGLIYTTETVTRPILRPCGSDVRITGLRIYGADEGECPDEWPNNCTQSDRTGGVNCRDCTPPSIGIQIRAHDRLEVDNCEIAGFSYAGIWLSDSVDNHIHHNYIHHTQRQGLGYGVVLTRGGDGLVTALIEWNRFDYYRHAVAGSGEPGQDYEARHNLVLENAIGHVFDMHGEDENTDNGSELAGGEILIHDNTVLAGHHYALVVRGRPEHGSWLYDNCLANQDAADAALQRHYFGNFYVDASPSGAAPNRYAQSASQCETLRWCFWPGATGPQQNASVSSNDVGALAFGDFDGDGTTDVFRTGAGQWLWSKSANTPWRTLNSSGTTLDRLRFGDFDGDGKTDVFTISGGERRVSDGGTGSWRTLNTATESLGDLGFGDFDGDGTTDLFRATGSTWQWSSGGTQPWADLNSSTYTIDQLAFADFDADGKTDVFNANGSQWRVSSGARQRWTVINSSSAPLDQLRFADFDGDAQADVFRSSQNAWWVSRGGSSSWQRLRVASTGIEELAFGDFDGDGRSDVFQSGCL